MISFAISYKKAQTTEKKGGFVLYKKNIHIFKRAKIEDP